MKVDYSKRYTDKKGSAVLKGVTANGCVTFVRRELPNGKPLTWDQYDAGKGRYATWNPFYSVNIKHVC